MLRVLAIAVAILFASLPGRADEAGIASAQRSIEGQINAFLADDEATAYDFAAPNIKRLFPTRQSFMAMVSNGYPMVRRPRSFSFGKAEAMGPGSIVQQVLISGPDGREYEAVYTLELQPDGVYRITGVSLRAANALST